MSKLNPNVKFHYDKCHYAECPYKPLILGIIMLCVPINPLMLSIIMMSVIVVSDTMNP